MNVNRLSSLKEVLGMSKQGSILGQQHMSSFHKR